MLELLETACIRQPVLPWFTTSFLRHGEILFRQDEQADFLYVVRSGRLRVIHNHGTPQERILRESGRGECIGEMALLSDEGRSATVVAIRDSELFQISKADFHRLVQQHPDTMLDLMRVITGRLDKRDSGSVKVQRRLTVAVLPAESSAPIAWFCETLRMCLPQARRSLVLNSAQFPPELAGYAAPSADEPPAGLARWLSEKEEDKDFLILQGDAPLTAWNRSCVRHADVILLLGIAKGAGLPGELERVLASLSEPAARPRIELVLVHESFPCAHSVSWSSSPLVSRRHHVRMHSQPDLARLARILTGQDVTLVLGGGGARAFAQIGVLKALEELRIPIDRIGGTSMGAVIGAHYALHQDSRRAISEFRRAFVERGRLNDFTLPLQSILSGRRYLRLLQKMFGATRIEDLPLVFFCMTCNLTRAAAVAHCQGPVWQWLSASCSVPGISPPFVHGGDLYVDGGVMNNLPVDVARQDGAGYIIAVDVSAEGGFRLDGDFQGRPSGWQVLRTWLPRHGKVTRFPSMFEVLMRTSELSSVERMNLVRSLADCYLRLPVAHFKLMDWPQIDRLVELGYRHGLEALSPVRAALPSVCRG
jgi:predicted acylesterase/phospholipase RssA